ncbi:MAG: PHP domain-containing protein [bacterium]
MKHRLDLHIHTCLSPCGDWSMSSAAIAKMAKHMHLDIIAVTDHNAIANIPAVVEACHIMGIEVISGIEIQTREEVHILGYFKDFQQISEFYAEFEKTLPFIKCDTESMGSQIVIDKNDEVVREEERFLGVSSTLSLDGAVELIHRFKGLALASHVDRKAFSVVSQLGFLPEETLFDGIEVYSSLKPYSDKYPVICSSDAHYVDEIGRRYSSFSMDKCHEGAGFEIFKEALEKRLIECHKGGF